MSFRSKTPYESDEDSEMDEDSEEMYERLKKWDSDAHELLRKYKDLLSKSTIYGQSKYPDIEKTIIALSQYNHPLEKVIDPYMFTYWESPNPGNNEVKMKVLSSLFDHYGIKHIIHSINSYGDNKVLRNFYLDLYNTYISQDIFEAFVLDLLNRKEKNYNVIHSVFRVVRLVDSPDIFMKVFKYLIKIGPVEVNMERNFINLVKILSERDELELMEHVITNVNSENLISWGIREKINPKGIRFLMNNVKAKEDRYNYSLHEPKSELLDKIRTWIRYKVSNYGASDEKAFQEINDIFDLDPNEILYTILMKHQTIDTEYIKQYPDTDFSETYRAGLKRYMTKNSLYKAAHSILMSKYTPTDILVEYFPIIIEGSQNHTLQGNEWRNLYIDVAKKLAEREQYGILTDTIIKYGIDFIPFKNFLTKDQLNHLYEDLLTYGDDNIIWATKYWMDKLSLELLNEFIERYIMKEDIDVKKIIYKILSERSTTFNLKSGVLKLTSDGYKLYSY